MACRIRANRALLLDVNGKQIGYYGLQEVLEMCASGQAVRRSRPKAQQTVGQLTQPRTPDRIETTTSISSSEMQANAGCMGGRRRPLKVVAIKNGREKKVIDHSRVGNFVDHAKTKIEIWPRVGDTKAVRVGPRG